MTCNRPHLSYQINVPVPRAQSVRMRNTIQAIRMWSQYLLSSSLAQHFTDFSIIIWKFPCCLGIPMPGWCSCEPVWVRLQVFYIFPFFLDKLLKKFGYIRLPRLVPRCNSTTAVLGFLAVIWVGHANILFEQSACVCTIIMLYRIWTVWMIIPVVRNFHWWTFRYWDVRATDV